MEGSIKTICEALINESRAVILYTGMLSENDYDEEKVNDILFDLRKDGVGNIQNLTLELTALLMDINKASGKEG